ncbi:MAG: O-antigen ligase family protein [Candidatus Cohnella colombiensis]|uniref:O-antigen ligase family protein n=1 Tax=Candidatus Cohnella colombiensis TaxID=3121368 RepID=A0AA95EUZ5_9BACL|nr:MAG: O-antigen ligase family protein [Cohnella sp.]
MDRLKFIRSFASLNVFEWMFYLFVLCLAMFPGRISSTFEVLDSNINYPLFIMMVGLLVFFPVIFIYAKEKFAKREMAMAMFLFIMVWALFSMQKASIRTDVTLGDRLIPLLLMGTAALLGYFYSKIASHTSDNNRYGWEDVITRFSFMLTFIICIYAAESLIGLGIRSQSASIIMEDVGIVRLKGPLGGAAIMSVVMTLTAGVYLGNVMKRRKPVILYQIALIITLVTILLTGSRSGVLAIGIFGLLIVFRMRSLKKIMQLGLGAMLAMAIVYPFISFDRISKIEDTSRTQTWQTAMKIATEYPKTLWMGKGYGTVWPWYLDERLSGGATIWPKTSVYGYTLYHPHSTYVELLVELGLIPSLVFIWILVLLIRHLYMEDDPDSILPYVISGTLAAAGTFAFDLYLFKNFQLSMIWWAFVFVVLAVIPRRNAA